MTLYAWIDENGNWCVAHMPPKDDSAVLMIALSEGASALFMDFALQEEINVQLRAEK